MKHTGNHQDGNRYLLDLRQRLSGQLFDNVIPFWQQFSTDEANGGYFNCLDRDGTVYDTKKYVWLQGRQAWMFAKLFNTVEKRTDWLDAARSGIQFLQDHARRADGRMYFSLTAEGDPVFIQRKIFSECFYAMALAEYARASRESRYLDEARLLFDQIWLWAEDTSLVGRPVLSGQTPLSPLSHPMILLNLIEELEPPGTEGTGRFGPQIESCIERMLLHVDEDRQIVRENILSDGTPHDSPEGRTLNPGHAIEAGWFLWHWAEHLDRDDLAETARNMIRWSFDRGWDEQHGGIFYFLDADGYSPMQLEWFMKLWWPITEALYATLLCYLNGRSEADLFRLQKVDQFISQHLLDPEHGEWFGYLDRECRVTHRFKGGPYKGCFHIPRALLLCVAAIDREIQVEKPAG